MNIGLDWDNTFTRDTIFWGEFVKMCKDHGHTVYITTSRSPDMELEFFPEVKSVIYCSFRAKDYVTKKQGIKIDIWIDDDPKYITEGFLDD